MFESLKIYCTQKTAQWQRAIHRTDKTLSSDNIVGELHFLIDILKYYETVIIFDLKSTVPNKFRRVATCFS